MQFSPAFPIRSRPTAVMLSVALATCATVPLSGQTVAAPAKPAATEEAIVLSPFTVSTERDQGFAAASSLAGGRLATDMRDTPAAYNVVTKELMDALDLRDIESTIGWSTSATLNVDNGIQNFFGSPINYTIRGAGQSRPQRNFFPQFNNGDAYNLERYEIGRGPNAILFGNGSLGGVLTSTTKRAQTNRPFQTVQASIGSWENYRLTIDVNRPLSDKVAVRAAAVWGDAGGWRYKDFDKRKAVFLTSTFKPVRGMEIRLEGEYGTNSKQVGFSNLNDRLSGWNGTTVYDTPAALATLPANANALGVGRRGANYFVFDPSRPTPAIMNYQNDPVTLAGGASTTTPIAGYVQGSLPAFNTNGAMFLHQINVPANRFATAIANSSFRVPGEEFTIAPDAPINAQRFKDLQFTLSHNIGRFFFEAAVDVNRSNLLINGEQNRGTADTYIDINRVRPDGLPNPNFLQPYGDGQFMRNFRTFAYNNYRAAAAYVLDTRFGNFTANLMGGRNEFTFDNDGRYLSVAQGTDHRTWGFLSSPATQNVRIRRYWNASSRGIPDLSLGTIKYIDPNTGTTQDIQPRWIRDSSRRDIQAHDNANYNYLLASLNAKFFRNRLVILGAVRADDYYFISRQQKDRGDYPTDWDGVTRYDRPDAPADYATLSFRSRDASGNPIGPAKEAALRPRLAPNNDRDPLYASDRFKDDFNAPAVQGRQITRSTGAVLHVNAWINPSINFAETFNPPGTIVRIDGRLCDPTVARGFDYGWRMELLQNRLNLNFTYYSIEEVNGIIGADGPNFFNTIYDANVVGDLSAVGRNNRGAGALPAQYRDLRTVSGKGFEVEVVANLSKAFRLTGSISFPKLYEANLNPDVRAYIDKNLPLLKQIVNDAGVLVDANNVATVDLSIPVNTRSPDATNAANAYNAMIAFRQNIVEGQRLSQDQPVASVFGDYTVQGGRLKGLRVGGGVRYRGRQIVGNRGSDTIVNPANPLTAVDDPTVDAYTPVYTPNDYYIVTGTLAYTWRLRNRREVQANLVVNNLLNDRGPLYSSNSFTTAPVRPKNNDYTSPARETVPIAFALKQPIGFSFTLTLKL